MILCNKSYPQDHRLTDHEDEGLAVEVNFDFVKTLKLNEQKKTKRNERGILLDGIIAQKLTDRAAGCVRVDEIETYGELFDRLRLLFEDIETLHSLQKQRDLPLMGRHESLESFISRFMKIQDEIRYYIDNMNAQPSEINIHHEIETENSVKSFFRGLREEYEIRIQPQNLENSERSFQHGVGSRNMITRKKKISIT